MDNENLGEIRSFTQSIEWEWLITHTNRTRDMMKLSMLKS